MKAESGFFGGKIEGNFIESFANFKKIISTLGKRPARWSAPSGRPFVQLGNHGFAHLGGRHLVFTG